MVLRGILISHGARIKRERNRQLSQLLLELATLEARHKHAPVVTSETELTTVRQKITDLLQYKAKAAIQICRKQTYESGNKCGKLLAKMVRQHKSATYIPHISTCKGTRATFPTQITEEFRQFYSRLYNLPQATSSINEIENYIMSSQMTSLPQEIRDDLESPITLTELQTAIKTMKPGKAPGPNGYTLQYYKTLFPTLGPRMVTLFNKIGEGKAFARETLGAHISVIHKEGKDPAACGSYRPISLLNLDLKLFTKILATRLVHHLQQLIHVDQIGFIPSREAKDGTIKVLNLIHITRSRGIPCVFLNTDAEKAFDRVSWQYMFAVLRHIGLGG